MFLAYLEKQAVRPSLFSEPSEASLGIIVVIPAYNEETLIPTIQSLNSCDLPQKFVEIIVVFNASEKDSEEVIATTKKGCTELKHWYQQQPDAKFSLYLIEEYNLPKKQSGVGLARKIGMDEAVRRFQNLGKDGVIVCFDADSKCQQNYFTEIEKHFQENLETEACSIHFEHPLTGTKFNSEVYKGIAYYELHLRYYKNGLAFAKLPFAFHTIGSSMAVRVSAYCKEGGMNKRKAGEDFYFLQKFISKGTLSELNSTMVIPSPRSSDRVPFGTGRAIKEMEEGSRQIELSYALEIFEVLQKCFANVEEWYTGKPHFESTLVEFIGAENLDKKLNEIRNQSTTETRFVKRFFQWFNAFKTLKFVHFLRDHYFKNKPLMETTKILLNRIGHDVEEEIEVNQLLKQYRAIDLAIKN
ncbi:MAG: glycosyltransferase [Vicingaceae bacterium]